MRVTRFQLLIIMLACVVSIAAIITISSYLGETHSWKYGAAESMENCTICHQQIEDEILSMPAGYPHRQFYVDNNCSACHVNASAGYVPGNSHTGTLPECTWCHPDTEPERDGDGVFGIQNLTTSTEAHNKMYVDATGSDHDPGKNEPCISCHTHVNMTVIFNRPQWYNFTVDNTWSITNVDVGPQYEAGKYMINYTNIDLGKHYWVPYKDCGTNGGCHQDVNYSRMGGISGGHHSNISTSHSATGTCTYCHQSLQDTKDYHAAKVVNCTYPGCHTPASANMTTLFNEIDNLPETMAKGDICWGCHSGYDWIDPGPGGIILQVETERNYNVSYWTGAWQQIYPDATVSCQSCHDDTLASVPPIPDTSGKYVHHSTAGAYDYGGDGSSGCLNCHDENWAPHDNPHDIQITYADYTGAMGWTFCNTTCHFSVIDIRPAYAAQTTLWMKNISTSWDVDGGQHETSTLINATGNVQCHDCHPEHKQRPDDGDDAATEPLLYGDGSQEGCGDQDLGVSGCHLANNGVADATDPRETPLSHGNAVSWVSEGRGACTIAGCHEKHNYTLDPTNGHDPKAQCHPGGSCWATSDAHPTHINNNFAVPEYDYNCSQCHFNSAGTWDSTYGTGEHNDGTVQVNFNTTAPSTSGIATFGGVLGPTYTAPQCADTYCHSNGYDVGGAGWIPSTPSWNAPGSVNCGDCHAFPPTTSSHPRHTDSSPYNFNCSVCHYDAGGVVDQGTYGTDRHVNGQVEVAFMPNSLADRNGDANYAPAWNGGTLVCSQVYCHNPSWDGAATLDTNALDTTPVWDDPTTTFCGAGGGGSCHGDRTQGNRPLSVAHNKHVGNNLPNANPNYDYACTECHSDAGFISDTYVSSEHVDGSPTIRFDTTNGIAVGFGTPGGNDGQTPTYTPGASLRTGTCDNVYCHSNGATSEKDEDTDGDGDGDMSGTAGGGDTDYINNNYDMVFDSIAWNAGVDSVGCSGQGRANTCHNGDTLGNAAGNTEFPTSGDHGRNAHRGVQCWWCHNLEMDAAFAGQGTSWQGTYGSAHHANANLWFNPHGIPTGTHYDIAGDENSYEDGHCGSGKTCWY